MYVCALLYSKSRGFHCIVPVFSCQWVSVLTNTRPKCIKENTQKKNEHGSSDEPSVPELN